MIQDKTKKIEYFKYGKKEIDWLKSRDKTLGRAIDRLGKIKREINPDLFSALVYSIIGQQISTKAHITIWTRMKEGIKPLTPAGINKLSPEQLQSFGISMRKAEYIKGIAEAVLDNTLDLAQLPLLSDDEVCQKLSELRGIGVWTAEMLMIFSMQRKNILSFGDLGIQRGLKILYKKNNITKVQFSIYKDRYSPYSSIASLYLWAITREGVNNGR